MPGPEVKDWNHYRDAGPEAGVNKDANGCRQRNDVTIVLVVQDVHHGFCLFLLFGYGFNTVASVAKAIP